MYQVAQPAARCEPGETSGWHALLMSPAATARLQLTASGFRRTQRQPTRADTLLRGYRHSSPRCLYL